MPKCSFATSGHCKIICYSLLSSSRLRSLACLIFFFSCLLLHVTTVLYWLVISSHYTWSLSLHFVLSKKWLGSLHNPTCISSVPCWNKRPSSMETWLEEHMGHVDVKVDAAWTRRAQGAACTSSEAPVEGLETLRPIFHCWSSLKAWLAFKGLHIFVQLLTISFMTWQLTNLLTPSSQLSWQKMMKNYVMQWCMTAAFHCRDRLQYLFHTQIAHLRLFFYRRNGLGACLVEVLYNKQQHKLEAVGDAKQLPRIFQKFFTNFTRTLH